MLNRGDACEALAEAGVLRLEQPPVGLEGALLRTRQAHQEMDLG